MNLIKVSPQPPTWLERPFISPALGKLGAREIEVLAISDRGVDSARDSSVGCTVPQMIVRYPVLFASSCRFGGQIDPSLVVSVVLFEEIFCLYIHTTPPSLGVVVRVFTSS